MDIPNRSTCSTPDEKEWRDPQIRTSESINSPSSSNSLQSQHTAPHLRSVPKSFCEMFAPFSEKEKMGRRLGLFATLAVLVVLSLTPENITWVDSTASDERVPRSSSNISTTSNITSTSIEITSTEIIHQTREHNASKIEKRKKRKKNRNRSKEKEKKKDKEKNQKGPIGGKDIDVDVDVDDDQDDENWLVPFLNHTPSAEPLWAHENPNDKPFYPPSWIHNYIRFHNAQLSPHSLNNTTNAYNLQHFVSKKTRWMQWYCSHGTRDKDEAIHCGGFADRLKGMLMSFMLSIIDRRVVLLEEWTGVHSSALHPLLDYLHPSLINWSVTPPHPEKAIPLRAYQMGHLEKIREMEKSHPCDITNFRKVHRSTGVRYTGNYLSKNIVFRNEKCLEHIFHDDDYEDITMTLFWTLFKFSEHVTELAHRLRGPIQQSNYYIAAHIRTGNNANFDDPLRQSSTEDFDQFAACIDRIQDMFLEHCGHRPMAYVASDNEDAKTYVREHTHRPESVHSPKIEIMHIDKTTSDSLEDATAAYDGVMGEFKVLMDATCLIGSDSGFSSLATKASRTQSPNRCFVPVWECGKVKTVKRIVRRMKCPFFPNDV